MNRPTINHTFRLHGAAYREKHPYMSSHERKVMRAIEACRTEELGGRIETCDTCGHTITLYNSCRNRHCPQCQNMKKEKWILERKTEILHFTYFHIVFTLPDALNPIVFHSKNKKIIFDLMFKTCKETLLSISAEEKYFGADIGFFAILHTWGQKLNPHPHLHCVVPGGGFSQSKQKWIYSPNNYFVPVQVLKMRFRSLFLAGLKKLHTVGLLSLTGSEYEKPEALQTLVDSLFSTEWVVYLKESFEGRDSVIEYLARYTHKIAISNHRIISLDNHVVTFKYKDYKDGNQEKVAHMDVFSFMRRFMLHVVPHRFVRIRYFGILSHRNKKKAIQACREFYSIKKQREQIPQDWRVIYLKKTGKNSMQCPHCNNGKLILKEQIQPIHYRAPPVYPLQGKTFVSF
jgi:hypothetical protein